MLKKIKFIFVLPFVTTLFGCNIIPTPTPVKESVIITFDPNEGEFSNSNECKSIQIDKGTLWKDVNNRPTVKWIDDTKTFNYWSLNKENKIDENYTFNEDITVYATYSTVTPEILNLEIGYLPTKTKYLEGEKLDLSGLGVYGIRSDKSIIDVTSECSFTPNLETPLETTMDKVLIKHEPTGLTQEFDITVYPKTVTITFDGNKGEVFLPNNFSNLTLDINYGTKWKDLISKPYATKEYADFITWTTTKDDLNTSINDEFVFDKDITLYAFYNSNDYEIKFIDRDVTIKTEVIKGGDEIIAPIDPKFYHEDGFHYSFDGWYDGDTKFVPGSKANKSVTYVSKFIKDEEYIVEKIPGLAPTCSTAGYKDAWCCAHCLNFYTDKDLQDDEHLIGDGYKYAEWTSVGGEGYIPPTEQHDYEVLLEGDYKKEYNALEEFDTTGLIVKLHCKLEEKHENDIIIDNYQLIYEMNDNKLHVNYGGVKVDFNYENYEYIKAIDLTINPNKVSKPEPVDTEFVYDKKEHFPSDLADTDDYTVIREPKIDAGTYDITVSLKDKGGDFVWDEDYATSQDLLIPFTISPANNQFINLQNYYTNVEHTAPGYTNLIYSRFGKPEITYTLGDKKTQVYPKEFVHSGTYFLKAHVDGTNNYYEITTFVPVYVYET